MSAIKITLEINSITEMRALSAALESYLDCTGDMVNDVEKEIEKGITTDWREIRDHRERKENLEAVKRLMKAIGA